MGKGLQLDLLKGYMLSCVHFECIGLTTNNKSFISLISHQKKSLHRGGEGFTKSLLILEN